MSGVNAVAVEVALEAHATCADETRARAVLSDAVAGSTAPRRGPSGRPWRLTMRVSALPGSHGKSADAVIVDDQGTVVSQRTVGDREAKTCAPLARALGVWATLVIDDEMTRAHDEALAAEPSVEAAPTTVAVAVDSADPDILAATHPAPDREVGASVFLHGGFGTSGIAGVEPFAGYEVADSWVLRPSALFGHATIGKDFSQIGAGLDFCRRVRGNYLDRRRGLELDVCGGAGGSVLVGGVSSGTASAGPSATLRGGLGAGLAIELRGVSGANVITGELLDGWKREALFYGVEVGLSWRAP